MCTEGYLLHRRTRASRFLVGATDSKPSDRKLRLAIFEHDRVATGDLLHQVIHEGLQ